MKKLGPVNTGGKDSGNWALWTTQSFREPLPFLHVPWGLAGIFFGLPAIGLDLLTSLLFSALSLLAEGKRGAFQVVPLALWALYVVFSLPLPPEHGVCVCAFLICASEPLLMQIVLFFLKAVCVHAPCLCALPQTSLGHSVRMCVPA